MRRSPMPRGTKPLARTRGLSRGAQLERGGTLERRVPVRPVSAKRVAENRVRRTMADAMFPERPLCVVYELSQHHPGAVPDDVLGRCRRWADDVNEVLSRARGGSITDPGNVNVPCRPCHDVLTFTPESELGWAYSAGLLAHSWNGTGGAA